MCECKLHATTTTIMSVTTNHETQRRWRSQTNTMRDKADLMERSFNLTICEGRTPECTDFPYSRQIIAMIGKRTGYKALQFLLRMHCCHPAIRRDDTF